ncbi:MAG TPA: diacylglycerol kinase family protein [Alphaproteobacteria bacterium]|jgi:YegS/Rv2252/BmrU family lipid kinase
MSQSAATALAMPDADGDPAARRMLLVFNPTAGRRIGRLDAILMALRTRGWDVTLQETTGPADATRIARGVGGKFDVLAVAGGDGTLNEAANGLVHVMERAPAMAVLPFGTANVLAHEIGLGTDEARVTAAAAAGRPTQIFLGQANDRRFLLMAGVGFDAAVVAGVGAKLKRRLGKGAYVWRMLVELFSYSFPAFKVTVDGTSYVCASAIVAKGHFYGGRFVCAPEARLTDPDFQVCLFMSAGRWAVVRYAVALGLGCLHKLSDIRLLRGRDIRIEGPVGAPVQGDGDIIAYLPAAMSIVPTPISVLYPS